MHILHKFQVSAHFSFRLVMKWQLRQVIQTATRTSTLNPEGTKVTLNVSKGGGLMIIRQISGSSTQHVPLSITLQTPLTSVSLISP